MSKNVPLAELSRNQRDDERVATSGRARGRLEPAQRSAATNSPGPDGVSENVTSPTRLGAIVNSGQSGRARQRRSVSSDVLCEDDLRLGPLHRPAPAHWLASPCGSQPGLRPLLQAQILIVRADPRIIPSARSSATIEGVHSRGRIVPRRGPTLPTAMPSTPTPMPLASPGMAPLVRNLESGATLPFPRRGRGAMPSFSPPGDPSCATCPSSRSPS